MGPGIEVDLADGSGSAGVGLAIPYPCPRIASAS